jgi:hypothetical protein
MCDNDNYEDDYNAAMREVRRLRGVAREYSYFYDKIKEAFEQQNWELVQKVLKG